MAYLISKSRISSDVIVLVTSSNCRIFSSRRFFFSPTLMLLPPNFWLPCSTLTNSPSFFNRKTSTALSRLSDGWRYKFFFCCLFVTNENSKPWAASRGRKMRKTEEIKKTMKRKCRKSGSFYEWAHFHQYDFYLIYGDKTVSFKSIKLSNVKHSIMFEI